MSSADGDWTFFYFTEWEGDLPAWRTDGTRYQYHIEQTAYGMETCSAMIAHFKDSPHMHEVRWQHITPLYSDMEVKIQAWYEPVNGIDAFLLRWYKAWLQQD